MTERRSTPKSGFGRIRRWAAALAVAGTAVLVHALGVAPARALPTVAPPHMEVAAHSGKALDIPGASHTPGTQLIQWMAHGDDNQMFRALPFADVGDIKLVILSSMENGLVVDVSGGSAEGAAVVQSPWSGTSSQVWWAAPFGDTGYTLYVNMGSGKVMTVAGASQADGARIVQGSWQGGLNQLWQAAVVID